MSDRLAEIRAKSEREPYVFEPRDRRWLLNEVERLLAWGEGLTGAIGQLTSELVDARAQLAEAVAEIEELAQERNAVAVENAALRARAALADATPGQSA